MTKVKRITWEDICKKVDCEKPSKNGIKIKQNALSEVTEFAQELGYTDFGEGAIERYCKIWNIYFTPSGKMVRIKFPDIFGLYTFIHDIQYHDEVHGKTQNDMEKRIDDILYTECVMYDDKEIEVHPAEILQLSYDEVCEILDSDTPRECLEHMMNRKLESVHKSCIYKEIFQTLKNNFNNIELCYYRQNVSEIEDYVYNHYRYRVDKELYNPSLDVSITLDTRNGMYDATFESVTEDTVQLDSSVWWLAESLGKTEKLKKTICRINGGAWEKRPVLDSFIKSCITELNEYKWRKGAITFLANIKFLDFICLREAMREKEKEKVQAEENEDKYGWDSPEETCLIIDRKTACGIYDSKNNTTGPFGIELPRNIRIPVSCIGSIGLELKDTQCGGIGVFKYLFTEDRWNGTARFQTEHYKA